MREPWTQLYVHLVWACWDRLPLLSKEIEQSIYACIQEECFRLRCESIAIGGTEDHVHLLTRFPTTITIADLTKQVKGSSSHLITHRLAHREPFKWQGAYGAFTVSRAEVPRVRAYILNQKQHHREGTLDEDFERIFIEQPCDQTRPGDQGHGNKHTKSISID